MITSDSLWDEFGTLGNLHTRVGTIRPVNNTIRYIILLHEINDKDTWRKQFSGLRFKAYVVMMECVGYYICCIKVAGRTIYLK